MADLNCLIAEIAPHGLQINLWAHADGYQANVTEKGSKAWTCTKNADPVTALQQALEQRCLRHHGPTTTIDPMDML